MDWQRKVLGELAERQRKSTVSRSPCRSPCWRTACRIPVKCWTLLNQSIPKMVKTLTEFQNKNVIFSQKWLTEIIQHLDPNQKIVAALQPVAQSTTAAQSVQDAWSLTAS